MRERKRESEMTERGEGRPVQEIKSDRRKEEEEAARKLKMARQEHEYCRKSPPY